MDEVYDGESMREEGEDVVGRAFCVGEDLGERWDGEMSWER